MSKAIENILGYTYLMKFVEAVRDGVPNPLPKEFTTGTEKGEGNTALLTRIYGQRQTATRIEYGAPFVERPRKKVDTVPVILPAFGDTITFDPSVLIKLRALDAYTLDMGKQIVQNDTKYLVTAYQNNRIAMAISTLANGKIWFGSDGRILPSSSGAVLTIDMGIPASHLTNLGGIIVDWATATNDIPGQLRQIKFQALQDTGFPIERVLYGRNIPTYMTQNNFVKDFLSNSGNQPGGGMDADYLQSGEIPNGLFGLEWNPIYTGFFEDAGEVNRAQVLADTAVFIPKYNSDWWSMVEGSSLVPTTIDIQTDTVAALNSMKLAHGMYMFGQVQITPAALKMFMGDVAMSYLKVPNAIFIATVH